MGKGALSERAIRTLARRLVTTMTILCATISRIRGFTLVPSKRVASGGCSSSRTLLKNSNIYSETQSRSVPTVINPMSKRRIHLGGPKYKQLIEEGGWIQHQGSFQRIDMEMLARHQQEPASRDQITIPPFEEFSNTGDEWYCITPSVLRETSSSSKAKIECESLIMEEETKEKLHNELLFVNKPSHLNCVPSRSLSESLATQVLSSYPGSKVCHRLDRDTSGIVLFGLTKGSHRDISMQFEARTTSKTYIALISGRPENDHGVVNLPIGKQKTKEGFNRWAIGGEKPRESITEWAIDKVFTDKETGAIFTKVILKPLTGRGHQLRLHMKAIGCPILGDTIHGVGGEAMCTSRLCLHAQKLQVDWNGLRLEAESIPPF